METSAHISSIQAVLLDMDGTLVDSDAAVERAWRAWAGEYGVPAQTVLAISHGNSADGTVRGVRPDLPEPAVSRAARRQIELQYDDLSDVVATSGAARLVETLRRCGLPWAVVTNADARLAAGRLATAGLAATLVVSVDDVEAGKPDPAGYRLAARRLGVDIGSCLAVEDSEPGLRAAREAGARTAALRGLDGDVRIGSLGELADLLDADACARQRPTA